MSNTKVMPTSFEPGAVTASGTVPLCVPELGGNEWKYVKECLDTNWVSSVGPFVDQFEQMLASYVGSKYAISTVNGTAALHVALMVAGVNPDEEVLLPALTFIAPANAVRYAAAWPVFIDIEPRHWQLDPNRVKDFLERECRTVDGKLINLKTGRRVRAIMPVHILGHPCDMDEIVELARRFDLVVIEDATESLGAKYKDRMVGVAGDIACFSFNGNKIITTGGGGMIVTNNADWANKAKYLTTQAKDDPLEYVHAEIGYNYRLPNMQAAMGCAQMELLPAFVAAKRRIASTYSKAFSGISGIRLMEESRWAFSTYWLYTILVNEAEFGMSNRELLNYLARNNIQARPLWQPLHRSHAHLDSPAYAIEVADTIHASALSLPSSVGLTESDQSKVIECVRAAAA